MLHNRFAAVLEGVEGSEILFNSVLQPTTALRYY